MINSKIPTIKNYISSLDTVIKSDNKKSLGSVLSLVNSSHQAVFIYNDKDEFQGLVSPYKTIYSNNYPYTTLVSSIAFRPPRIEGNTKIYKVVKYMIASKIYMLPVFDDKGAVEGIVYGKDIALNVIKNPSLLTFIKDNMHPNIPITAPYTSLVQDVFNLIKEKNVSKIVLVDNNGAMKGIVTRSDLMKSVIKPTSKMRFSNEGSFIGRNSFAGEKKSRKEEQVLKFATSVVSSLPNTTSMKKIITYLVTSSHNSVVLLNKQRKPTGFLSMKDILKAISLMKPEENIPIIVKKPSKSVSDTELKRAIKHLESFSLKLGKRIKIKRIEVVTEEPKNQKGQTHKFNTTVMIIPIKGNSIISLTKNRGFLDGIQEATKIIEKQERRQNRIRR